MEKKNPFKRIHCMTVTKLYKINSIAPNPKGITVKGMTLFLIPQIIPGLKI